MVVFRLGWRTPSNVIWLVLIARRIGLVYSFSGNGIPNSSSVFHA